MTPAPVLSARRLAALPFLQVEGLGNDFLLLDLRRPADGPRPPTPGPCESAPDHNKRTGDVLGVDTKNESC